METTYKLKASEIDFNFFKMLKQLLGKDENIEITLNTPTKIPLILKPETKAEMKKRIDKAIEDTERGENLITFTPKEFDKYMKSKLKK